MINTMTVTELKQKLENKEELILVDCREQGEWDEGHIAEAKFIPLSNFQEEFPKHLEGKEEANIILQCRSGKRSLNACQLLQHEDYENLFNLEGGILAWQEAGFEIIK